MCVCGERGGGGEGGENVKVKGRTQPTKATQSTTQHNWHFVHSYRTAFLRSIIFWAQVDNF